MDVEEKKEAMKFIGNSTYTIIMLLKLLVPRLKYC